LLVEGPDVVDAQNVALSVVEDLGLGGDEHMRMRKSGRGDRSHEAACEECCDSGLAMHPGLVPMAADRA